MNVVIVFLFVLLLLTVDEMYLVIVHHAVGQMERKLRPVKPDGYVADQTPPADFFPRLGSNYLAVFLNEIVHLYY